MAAVERRTANGSVPQGRTNPSLFHFPDLRHMVQNTSIAVISAFPSRSAYPVIRTYDVCASGTTGSAVQSSSRPQAPTSAPKPARESVSTCVPSPSIRLNGRFFICLLGRISGAADSLNTEDSAFFPSKLLLGGIVCYPFYHQKPMRIRGKDRFTPHQTGMMPVSSPTNSWKSRCFAVETEALQKGFQSNRHDAGCITDQLMEVPLLCGRIRSFAKGLSE